MPVNLEFLQNAFYEAFPDADLEITDTVGDGDHYQVVIASSKFNGLSLIQQHKLVYNALGEVMGNQLHAMALITRKK